MFVGLHVWGAFVFWAGVCVVGLVVLGVWAPETKGVALERMDELFRGRWYKGWKASVGPDEVASGVGAAEKSRRHAQDAEKGAAYRLERVSIWRCFRYIRCAYRLGNEMMSFPRLEIGLKLTDNLICHSESTFLSGRHSPRQM